jgi:hypothetical protein
MAFLCFTFAFAFAFPFLLMDGMHDGLWIVIHHTVLPVKAFMEVPRARVARVFSSTLSGSIATAPGL